MTLAAADAPRRKLDMPGIDRPGQDVRDTLLVETPIGRLRKSRLVLEEPLHLGL
ncbi:MAG: hypothetical protein AAF376_03810 [Pseudomonadota bacterium]